MTKKILFVVPCTPYFPSGVVRVEAYLPYFDVNNIEYKLLNFNTPAVQRNLHWLDQSIFAKNRLVELCFRVFFHLSGIPYRWFRQIQILLLSFQYDVVFLQAILPPVWFSKVLTKINRYVVYDYDDAQYNRNARRVQKIIQNVWKVIAGSHVLFDYAAQYNDNVVLIPSAVPLQNYKLDEYQTVHTPLRIGWIGGASTLNNLRILEEPFRALLVKGYEFEIFIAGSHGKESLIPEFKGVPKTIVPVYKGEEIPELVKEFDVGVMPLLDEPWERGKCAMKALIYMAAGLPSISSPVGEPAHIVVDGENGFLANSPRDWINKLEALFTSSELRERVGQAGRNTVAEGYSTDVCFEVLKREIFDCKKQVGR
jgi:glycosyltransferase involved in cell wall biosynthesis